MNDDLEQRLRALIPAEPPEEMMRDLRSAEPPAMRKIHWLRFAIPLGAAAAVAMALTLNFHRESELGPATVSGPKPSDFRVFLPVELTSTLLEVRDVAVIDREPTRPLRLVRATWLDDITYTGDDGHSTMRRREPRTEIIPVALEVF